ncbi:MAG TPA: DUF2283 domain-containing protein [Thermoanaerobaculia bacterium]|jgi:uncharacterized protein YuzE|nr:DUF2283 domain-containing protein [Thermoanaerobaculia bacterium]
MRYSYNDEGDSLFISLRDGDYDESEEIYDGFVIDFDKSGRPLNIDIYRDASKFVDIPRLLRSMAPEPEDSQQPLESMLVGETPFAEKT